MKLTLSLLFALFICAWTLPAHAAGGGSSTHPKPHKIKKHKGVKHHPA